MLHTNVKLSRIGTPIVKQRKGHNELVVSYRSDRLLDTILIFNFISWLIVFYMNYKFKFLNE